MGNLTVEQRKVWADSAWESRRTMLRLAAILTEQGDAWGASLAREWAERDWRLWQEAEGAFGAQDWYRWRKTGA